MKQFRERNKKLWDEWTAEGFTPAFDFIEQFKNNVPHLRPFEIEEVGDVTGKSLLHLQCHFGLDTLSWARQGAEVVGADISETAIEKAKALAEEVSIDARFIAADVYDLPVVLDEQFDIVYTSFGVLSWLSDITEWGRVVARFVKPGGFFYLAEYHPVLYVFDDDMQATEPRIRHPYFERPEPVKYTDPKGRDVYGWRFTLGGVVTSLADAGLDLEFLHEFPFTESQQLPYLEFTKDGWWRLHPRHGGEIPLTFSLKARKPEDPA